MTELKTTIYHESGRIDKVLTNLFSNYSRSQIQLWLKERCGFCQWRTSQSKLQSKTRRRDHCLDP